MRCFACHRLVTTTHVGIAAIHGSLSFFPAGGWFPVTWEVLLMKISTAMDDTKLRAVGKGEKDLHPNPPP